MTRIMLIALNTYRELIRGKVLYLVMFFAAALVLISALFGSVTIGDQAMVVKDFGLFSISVFSVAFAVIAGAALLHKELSRKTIYNILSKPVCRWEFLLGKFCGMAAVSFLMIVLMGAALMLFTSFFERSIDLFLLQAFAYIFLEILIVCAAAIFFSSLVVTPVLSGLFTLGVFLAGRCVEYLLYFVREGSASAAAAAVLKGLYFVLPQFARLNISGEVVFHNWSILTYPRFLWSALYAVGYAGILLILANILFRRREFN